MGGIGWLLQNIYSGCCCLTKSPQKDSSCFTYTRKNAQVVAILMKTARIEQCFAAHIVHSCQQYWTILLHPIQAQQHCSILLTSVNNVGSKTLFNRQFQLLVYACRGWWEVRFILPIMLKKFNKNCRNNRNIAIFTSIRYHSVFTRPPFLFFQHNQQHDTLFQSSPARINHHKLKAGIAYSEWTAGSAFFAV
jgi:hypothetical protein